MTESSQCKKLKLPSPSSHEQPSSGHGSTTRMKFDSDSSSDSDKSTPVHALSPGDLANYFLAGFKYMCYLY